jgi:radical SAM-linked protein
MQVDTLNRLRLTFDANGPLRWIGHLDLVRTWERAIRRSGLRLAYSKGYSPHPRIALAAPLAVGISGQNELMDIWLENDILPLQVQNELSAVLSPGLSIHSTELVALDLPPMQSLLKSAIYEISFNSNDLDKQQITESIDELLGKEKRMYDLRATIIDLQLISKKNTELLMIMNLSMEEKRTGRPNQILKALNIDIDPRNMIRTQIEMFSEKVN